MKAQRTRTKAGRWCRIEVELKDGRLSICGSEGRILPPAKARAEAREYWKSFFEEDRSRLHEMNDRCGTNFRTAAGAARYVLGQDGEYHGLDAEEGPNGVYLTESCGQIRESLAAWFPEYAPYFRYHLNDMHAECEHQEARGETYTTHPGAICPECGYSLGSKWLRRDLPADVIAWAEGLKSDEVTA